MTKKSNKRKNVEVVEEKQEELPPTKRLASDEIVKKPKWINKQRVMVFATRGINHRHRHLMEDIKTLMPHHKPESKMERTKNLSVVNEVCEMKNCNKAMMFEGRKKRDLYVWLSNVPTGPSVKFLVENIYTMAELKLTGNCLRGSRPILSFDTQFKEKPHYQLLKEILTQIFGVPYHHPKSQPFFDHVYTFTILDNRIWFRNFQILSDDGALAEIGPRFVLNPVKIFSDSFGGQALWENPTYTSPAKLRQMIRKQASNKYINRVEHKKYLEATRPKDAYKLTPLNDIFEGNELEKAKALEYGDNEADKNSDDEVLQDADEEVKVTKKKNKKNTGKKSKVVSNGLVKTKLQTKKKNKGIKSKKNLSKKIID